MKKNTKYLITSLLAFILIGTITYYFKNTDTTENISKLNSSKKSLHKHFEKSISSDNISIKPFVKSKRKQAKKNKQLFDSNAVTFT